MFISKQYCIYVFLIYSMNIMLYTLFFIHVLMIRLKNNKFKRNRWDRNNYIIQK